MDVRVKNAQLVTPTRESAFRAARSHSRLVRFLKIAVPAAAFAGAATFVFFAWFNPFRPPIIQVEGSDKSSSDGLLEVKLPHLTGSNNRGQKYDVTSSAGTQKVTAPGVVSLTDLNAVISAVDSSKATLTAKSGVFDSNAQVLTLQDNVRVQSTKGYDAALKSGTIDFKSSTVNSTEPVTVNLSNGTISANSLTIVQGGSKITFKGGVSASFKTPLKPETDDAASDDGNASLPDDDNADQTGSAPPDSANPVQGTPSP